MKITNIHNILYIIGGRNYDTHIEAKRRYCQNSNNARDPLRAKLLQKRI